MVRGWIYIRRSSEDWIHIGRWWQLDPRPNAAISPYAAMELNPILYGDFMGDTIIASTNGRIIQNKADNNDFVKTTNPLPTVTVTANSDAANTPTGNQYSFENIPIDNQSTFAPGIPISPIGFSPKPIDIPQINIPEVGIGVLGRILGTIGLVLFPVNYGQPSSDHLPPRPIILPSYHVPPQALSGFPDAVRVPQKTHRARWKLPDGSILEWDYQHGRVEKYNPRGKHQGEFDPNTGEQTKPRDQSRTTEN